MKNIKISILMLGLAALLNHAEAQVNNIVIVTTDGYRWQELFNGADHTLATSKTFSHGDSVEILKKYWDSNSAIARAKVMPFMWGTIAKQGQVYGNRALGNNVNTANPYWFSYPGYNEIFTGYPDVQVNSNDYKNNPNITVLEFLNKQPKFKGKVAAFASWDAFDRILDKPKSGFPVVAAFEKSGGLRPTANEKLLNKLLGDSYRPFGDEECLDVFTHYAAMEYLKTRKPKVLYISYGETDEWAHAGNYLAYLNAAHQVDKWLGDIWATIQSDPLYKGHTALLITTDHGRGADKEWTSHGQKIKGASEIWFAVMGPGIAAKGEMKIPMQNHQEQLAQTIASLLGTQFKAEHPVADKIVLP